MKVKIFRSPDVRLLEDEINRWLENNSWVKLVKIKQSSTEKETIISIWYNEPDVPILG